jgi:hypothetical protein
MPLWLKDGSIGGGISAVVAHAAVFGSRPESGTYFKGLIL